RGGTGVVANCAAQTPPLPTPPHKGGGSQPPSTVRGSEPPSSPPMTALLEVQHVTQRFGGLVANRDISIKIERGELVGLIGPNGAGKPTLFNLIAGVMRPSEGRMRL